MKILRLRLKNIHSLKGEHQVDFTKSPLADSGIFAIIGPTGAGKSTLLDVITLALYNRTPRIGQLSKTAVKNMGTIITRNTEDCYAEIEYEVKNKQYRSRWEISTARSGELRDYEMLLAEVPSGNIISSKKGEIPQLNTDTVGLNYEQFVKSIVLSQGEFAKFLKATPEERSELLEKITGTEIYRKIGKAAFDKHKEENEKLNNLKIQKEAIKLLTSEQIDNFNNQLIDNQRNVFIYTKRITEQEKLFNIKQNIKNLENQREKLTKQKIDIDNQILYFEPQIQKLNKHQRLINLKANIIELKNSHLLQENNINKLTTLENKLETNNISLHDNLQKLEKFNADADKLTEQENILLPKILKCRELDIEIKNLTSQIKQLREIFIQKTELYSATEDNITTIKKTITDNNAELQKQEIWVSENTILTTVEKELALIKEKIANFEDEEQNLKALLKKLSNKNLQQEINKLNSWEEILEYIDVYIAENKKLATEILNNLDIDINNSPELDNRLEELKNIHNELKNLINISNNYLKNDTKTKDLTVNNSQITLQIAEDENNIYQLKIEIEIAEKYIEELKIRKDRQQLEAKYAEDRKKLIPNQECFLCGATTHPYVKHYVSQLDDTIINLKNKETAYKNLQLKLQQTNKSLITNQSIFKNNANNIAELEKENSKLLADFENINLVHNLSCDINNQEDINTKIIQTIEKGKNIRKQKEAVTKYWELKQIIDATINFSDKVLNINHLKNSLKNTLAKYKKYFDNKTNYSDILHLLEKYVAKYNATNEQILQINKNILANKNILTEKQINLDNLKKDLTAQKNVLDEVKRQNENLKQQRYELLENKTADEVENKIKFDITNSREKVAHQTNVLTKLKTEKQAIINNINEIKETIENNKLIISRQEEFLLPKLLAENITSTEDALKSILEEKTIVSIQKQQEELNNKKVAIIQSLSDNQEQLEILKTEDNLKYNYDTLNAEIQQNKKDLENKNRDIGIIKNKLEENETRKIEHSALEKDFLAQSIETTRWENLNRLIGDAAGKKFTLLAQQLTLNELIIYSNIHLKGLNDRYILKKSDNLKENLIVIDTYMGNTERSVQTLSGGESFLLSLALALGLSDLASKNTRIECLFIDEGFGTLDHQTLDTAIATLEKLQLQTKRTIGIISHVPSIKERITNQIELRKLSSGFSTIVI